MHRKVLTFISVLFLFLTLYVPCSSAFEFKGKVVARYDRIILMQTMEGALQGVNVTRDAKLLNLKSHHDLREGDSIHASGERMLEGMLVATELRADSAEVDTAGVETIKPSRLSALLISEEDVTVIDTRPRDLYEKGHIPGAVTMPVFDPEVLPKDKEGRIAFYSQGKRDPSALDGLRKAGSLGYTVVVLYAGGARNWVDRGYYLEVSPDGFLELDNTVVIDLRDKESFLKGHIPGAQSIPLDEISMETLWQYSPDPVLLYDSGADDDSGARAADMLYKYGGVTGTALTILAGGYVAWVQGGMQVEEGPERTFEPVREGFMSLAELLELWESEDKGPAIVYLNKNIRKHILDMDRLTLVPIEEFPFGIKGLDRDREVVLICSSGYRARMGYHILKNAGYRVRYVGRPVGITPEGVLKE